MGKSSRWMRVKKGESQLTCENGMVLCFLSDSSITNRNEELNWTLSPGNSVFFREESMYDITDLDSEFEDPSYLYFKANSVEEAERKAEKYVRELLSAQSYYLQELRGFLVEDGRGSYWERRFRVGIDKKESSELKYPDKIEDFMCSLHYLHPRWRTNDEYAWRLVVGSEVISTRYIIEEVYDDVLRECDGTVERTEYIPNVHIKASTDFIECAEYKAGMYIDKLLVAQARFYLDLINGLPSSGEKQS